MSNKNKIRKDLEFIIQSFVDKPDVIDETLFEIQYIHYLEAIKMMNESTQYYYSGVNPPLSDSAWDILLRAIKQYEKKHPDKIVRYSPTQAIQFKVGGKPSIEHDHPALSIENIYDLDDSLMNFLKRISPVCKKTDGSMTLYVEPKYDGCAVSLTYKEDGTLNYVATRGNGKRGFLVTDNFLKVIDCPKYYINRFKDIEEPDPITIRGELVMFKDDFRTMNEELDKKKSNPRNAVSGFLNMKGTEKLEDVLCYFKQYDIFRDETKNVKFADPKYGWTYFMDGTFRLNVDADPEKCIDVVRMAIDNLMEKKNSMPYCMDGVVIKIYDKEQRKILGETDQHPKWAIAYKQKDSLYKTKVLHMNYTVGKLGVITPVISFKGIVIGGVFNQNATMHNYNAFKNMNLRYGDEVLIKRSAEVIPKVVMKVTHDDENTKSEFIKFPEKCPACGEPLTLTPNGINYYCYNDNCKGRRLSMLISAVDRKHLNIYNLGEGNVTTLFRNKFLYGIDSLFELKKYRDQIKELPGFNFLSTDNIIKKVDEALDRCRKEPYRLLASFPIPLLGPGVAKNIFRQLTMERLIEIVKAKDFNQFQVYFGKLEKLFLSLCENCMLLEQCQITMNYNKIKVVPTNTYKNAGRSKIKIAISGEVKGYANREETTEAIESMGFTFQSSVNTKTSFLLTNPDNDSSKIDKANDLEIPVIYSLDDIKDYYKNFETGEKVLDSEKNLKINVVKIPKAASKKEHIDNLRKIAKSLRKKGK